MEFHYRKKPVNHHILFAIFMVFIVYSFVISLSLEGFTYFRLLQACFLTSFAIGFWLRRVNYYKLIEHDIILLDEESICHIRHGIATCIPWTDVKKVEWGKDKQNKALSILRITDNTGEIGIGRNIERLDNIVRYLKLRVDDRFNTRNVPSSFLSFQKHD
jgi:hypothetical protein